MKKLRFRQNLSALGGHPVICSKARPFDCEQGMDAIANNVFISLGSNIICNKTLREVNPQATFAMQVQTPGNLELRPLPHLPAGGGGSRGRKKICPNKFFP